MTHINRLENLRNLHQESPEDPFLWFALAKEFEKIGKPGDAAQWYKKLIGEAPEQIGTYYHYGKFLASNGFPAKARKILHLGKALALKMRDQKTLSELIQLLGEIEGEEE